MSTVIERSAREALPRLRWVRGAKGRLMLDRQARKLLGISGEEFLRRWTTGQYAEQVDDPDHPEVRRVARLIPFAQ